MVDWVAGHRATSYEMLGQPLRVVVPSASLRRHLLAVLARRLGALAGTVVQTHRSLAREVVTLAGETTSPGDPLIQDLLIRRFAAQHASLHAALDHLEDGYAASIASVRDLLDAGLETSLHDALLEALDDADLGAGVRARSMALVEVACACAEAQDELGLAGPSQLLADATSLLETRGPSALPCRGLLIHGFADATGRVTDLLRALVRHLDAEVIVDHPMDPAAPETRDAGWRHTERIMHRLSDRDTAGKVTWISEPPSISPPHLTVAPTADLEIRCAADRIRALIDEGARAEHMAVVTRKIDPAIAAGVRRHFHRLGIPFSGEAATISAGRQTRRARTLLQLLSEAADTPTSSWLECVVPDESGHSAEVELAFRSLGARVLGQAANIHLDPSLISENLRLPVVDRIEPADDRDRHVWLDIGRATMQAAQERAAKFSDHLESRPDRAAAGELFDWIHGALTLLGWQPDGDDEALFAALEQLRSAIPDDLQLRWRELEPQLAKTLEEAASEAIGGCGGGVQVLTVMEARSRTFDHVFVLGLNRGRFPQQVQLDPLLGESARRALLPVLPDIPFKERAPVEERYLFAQLAASSHHLMLSCHTTDSDGTQCNPSVFVERLRLEQRIVDEPPPAQTWKTPVERAIDAGLSGERRRLAALCDLVTGGPHGDTEAVIEAHDPAHPPHDLGAFLGRTGLGPPETLWVTQLEGMVRCPWRHFLERQLGLAPPPASAFAETALDGWLVGDVVHGVLEDIVRAAGAFAEGHLEAVRQFEPALVAWPEATELDGLIRNRAQRHAFENGVPALAPALAVFSRTYLERARTIDWAEGPRVVLGAEITGHVALEHGDRMIDVRFRTDRVDPRDDGLALTDYKTSSPGPKTVPDALCKGKLLQGAAYALAAGEQGVGRYVVLKDGERDPVRTVHWVDADQLPEIVAEILDAWQLGVWFPRMTTAKMGPGPACRFCRVKPACMQDDSGFRARLVRTMAHDETPAATQTLWLMPDRKTAKKKRSSR